MMATWHPQCFTCEMCHKELADLGFIKNQGEVFEDNQSRQIDLFKTTKLALQQEDLLVNLLTSTQVQLNWGGVST
jgi:LIM domain